MPFFTDSGDALRWMDSLLRTPPPTADALLKVISFAQCCTTEGGDLEELRRPSPDADDEVRDRFFKGLEQQLQILITCSDEHGSPVLVYLHGTYKFLLELKDGGTPTASDLLRVRTALGRVGGVGAELVDRLRVSGVSEDPATGKRRRHRFIEVEVNSIAEMKAVKTSLPLFRCLHLDPLVKRRSFEQPGPAMFMARLGVQPGAFVIPEAGSLMDDSTASVPVIRASGLRLVERTADMPSCEPLTLGWDLETSALSPNYGDIFVVSAAFWTTRMKAVMELGVCVRGREMMRRHMDTVLPSGVPSTHAVLLFSTEREMVCFFLTHCLSRPIFSWGYNSAKFDVPWLVAKSRARDWDPVHWLPHNTALLTKKDMSSRAMNNNTLQLIITLAVHDDLLWHAWKHCRFTPGNLSLNNVVFKTSGLSKASYDHTKTLAIVRNPERFPLEFMKMLLYGGQDSALLMCLARPSTSAEDVLGPMGVTEDMLLRVLRLTDFRDICEHFPDLPAGMSIDQQRAWVERTHSVRCVYAEDDEPVGIADDLRMLPDGTKVGKSGSSEDFWRAPRGGLDANTFVLQVSALCMIQPSEVLPYGQQKRMTAMIYVNAVVGIDGLFFVFDVEAELEEKGSFEGGAVENLSAGIWGLTGYLDASAMYPNLILNHGLSPECPQGLSPSMMHLSEELLLPSIVHKLLGFRRRKEALIKECRKRYEESGDEFEAEQANFLSKQVTAMKGTINSIFGYCGSSTNSFGKEWHGIAEAITRNGREQITAVKSVVNALTFERMLSIPDIAAIIRKHELETGPAFKCLVIYGDTDSKAATLVLEENDEPAYHVPWQAAQDLFGYMCDHMAELGDLLGITPHITLKMGIEDLYMRILGCNQSKTYAGKIIHALRGGEVELRLIAKGLAVVRGDRFRVVVWLQRKCLNIALDENDRTVARDKILRLTWDTMQLVSEAGSGEFAKMSVGARQLLPFGMLKVWGGQAPHTSAQATVAAKMNRDGIMAVSSGEKVAYCVGPGSASVKDRSFPIYEAMCSKNPRGLRQCPVIVNDAIVSAVARVVAAVCSINDLKEAERVIRAYAPSQRSLSGDFAPIQRTRMMEKRKRAQGTKTEQAASMSRKLESFGVTGGVCSKKRARKEPAQAMVQSSITNFFTK